MNDHTKKLEKPCTITLIVTQLKLMKGHLGSNCFQNIDYFVLF